MLDVVGVGWSNVDEDAYRDMTDALREFEDDADDDAYGQRRVPLVTPTIDVPSRGRIPPEIREAWKRDTSQE